jgi:hypothetical protein
MWQEAKRIKGDLEKALGRALDPADEADVKFLEKTAFSGKQYYQFTAIDSSLIFCRNGLWGLLVQLCKMRNMPLIVKK